MIGFLLGAMSGLLVAFFLNLTWRRQMAISLTEFAAEVEQTETVHASAIQLLTGLSDRIKELVAAGADLDAFAALAQRLDLTTNALAAAVQANTIADGETPVEEPVDPPVTEPVTEPVVEAPVVEASTAKSK